jgi:hypothetical protein
LGQHPALGTRPADDRATGRLAPLHYTLPWWRHDGRWFQISPTQLLERPDDFPEHRDRIQRADLSYPLHVTRRRGHWLVIDGIHRLVKADTQGATAVRAHPVPALRLREVLV